MNIQPVVHLDPGGETAKGRWRAFAMFGSFGGGATWAEGVYEMTYAKENGVWKIKKLDYHSGFGAPYATGWVPPAPRPAAAAGGGGGPRWAAQPAVSGGQAARRGVRRAFRPRASVRSTTRIPASRMRGTSGRRSRSRRRAGASRPCAIARRRSRSALQRLADEQDDREPTKDLRLLPRPRACGTTLRISSPTTARSRWGSRACTSARPAFGSS